MANQPAAKSVRQALEESKRRFLAVSNERVENARSFVMQLQKGDNQDVDMDKVNNVCHILHQLAGASGLYEMTDFSNLTITCEEIALKLKQAKGQEFLTNCEQLIDFIDLLRHIISVETGTATTNDTNVNQEKIKQAISGSFALNVQNLILIVSNVQNLAMEVKSHLTPMGFEVHFAQNWAEAMSFLEGQTPKGIIVQTPVVGGSALEIATAARSKAEGSSIPIVFYGEEQNFQNKIKSIKAGCDAFIESTIKGKKLGERIKRVFAKVEPKTYRVLLVEDDTVQASIMNTFLASGGYEPNVITDPSQFEEALLSFKPDIILLDVMLGQVTGFELAKYVRQNEKFTTTPIIFLTTQNQLRYHIEGARLGDDYLIKPAPPELLIATIAGRLERYKVLADQIGKDALTGTLNHAEFMNAANEMRNKSGNKACALVIDINKLGVINHEHGYATGEKVIVALADLLKGILRSLGTLGRIAGDEFGVITDNLTDKEVLDLAGFLCAEFSKKQFTSQSGTFSAAITCGISRNKDNISLEEWIKSANDALRTAKEYGTGSIGMD